MNLNNSFILLGRTGVGKSTLAKILSENPSIIIGESANSITRETQSYNCEYDNFKYSIIDTPGYDDSKGEDKKNYQEIKKFLTSDNIQIKGIILMFNFQDPRFSECHSKGLQKIVKLIPLQDFWDYVTIIFTRYYNDGDEEELEEQKNKRLNEFREKFDVLISAFNKAKGTKIVSFSHINKIFVNLKIKKTKKHQLNDIISTFKNLSKLEPLYHKVKIEEKWDKVIVKNKNNSNKGTLYEVKFKVYTYYNQKGDVIKILGVPKEQKKIKELERKDFTKVEDTLMRTSFTTFHMGIWSACLALATIAFPPTFGFFAGGFLVNWGISIGATFAGLGVKPIEKYCNKDFREAEIVNELFNEDDDE